MRKFLISLGFAIAAPIMALATEKHGGHDMGMHEGMAGVHAEATVNSFGEGTANVTHGPIAEIGWPGMTMDLALLEGAEIDGVEPGDDVMMMLEKGPDGMFAIRALVPVE